MTLRTVALLLTSTLCYGADGDTAKAVFAAIRADDLTTLRTLVQKTGNANLRGDRDTTPLMFASAYGSVPALRILLDAGADVNAANALGHTALMWSVSEPVKAKLLIDRGADVNAKAKTVRTALIVAGMTNDSDAVVEALLAKGADVGAVDTEGNSFLLAAAGANNSKEVRLALQKGADVNSSDALGNTALMNAAGAGDVESVKILLAKGADVNAVSKPDKATVKNGPIALGNLTALLLAAPYGPPEVVQLLINAGAKVDARDVRGMTPLHLALGTESQNPEIIRMLLKAGARIDSKSGTSETPGDWAAKYNRPDVVKLIPVVARIEKANSPSTSAQHLSPRASAERSLQLLQKVSGSFMATGGCVSCHAQNLTAVANHYAQLHGLAINVGAQQGMAAGLKGFLAGSRDGLLVRSDPPGGLDTLNYTLLHLSAAGIPGDTTTDSIVHNIAAQQMKDGGWHRGSIARAPMEDSDIAATALAVRAMKMYAWPGRQADLDLRTSAARAWLLRAKPVFNEEYGMQILGLTWAGGHDTAGHDTAKMARSLMAQQRDDGGWSQNPNLASDAYATGQTLFALVESGNLKPADPVFQKGIDYLLATQHEDGSWHVKSRAPKFQPYFQSGFPYDHDQWISMAGTAWATVALTFALR